MIDLEWVGAYETHCHCGASHVHVKNAKIVMWNAGVAMKCPACGFVENIKFNEEGVVMVQRSMRNL
jgi:phage FluMu protein Com